MAQTTFEVPNEDLVDQIFRAPVVIHPQKKIKKAEFDNPQQAKAQTRAAVMKREYD